ncbi:unnamed protein product [Peronospora belbahrii]|uniref:Uncharacterized protein n=1 Tax=Peronospora belbahrii TaxID=622444 RepID=A0AAU9L3R2_9STRA|nr:unnamed protein product [Peronospora belbahrii]
MFILPVGLDLMTDLSVAVEQRLIEIAAWISRHSLFTLGNGVDGPQGCKSMSFPKLPATIYFFTTGYAKNQYLSETQENGGSDGTSHRACVGK